MNAQSSNNNTLAIHDESTHHPSLTAAIQSGVQSENGQVGQTQLQTALQVGYSQGYIKLQVALARIRQHLGVEFIIKVMSMDIQNGSVVVKLHGERPKFKNPNQVKAGVDKYASFGGNVGWKGANNGVRAALKVETDAPLQQVCILAVGTDARVRFGVDESLINTPYHGRYLSILGPNDVASDTVNDEFGSASDSKVQVMVRTISRSLINREQVVVWENNPRSVSTFTEETELRFYNSQFAKGGDWAGATMVLKSVKKTNTVETNHHGLPLGDYKVQYEGETLIKMPDGIVLHPIEHNNISKGLMDILHKFYALKDVKVAVKGSSFGPGSSTLDTMYKESLEASLAASDNSELQSAYANRSKSKAFTRHISGNPSTDEQAALNSVIRFDPNKMAGHDENGDGSGIESALMTTAHPKKKKDNAQAGREIQKPGPNDVMIGRGGGTNNHSGNIKFRRMVEDLKATYKAATSRSEKRTIASNIITEWRALDPPGRFLERNDETGLWNDIGDVEAHKKCTVKLREKETVRESKKRKAGEYDSDELSSSIPMVTDVDTSLSSMEIGKSTEANNTEHLEMDVPTSFMSSSNSESSLMMPESSDSSESSLMPELLKRWIQPPNDRNYYGSVSKDAPGWVQSLHYYYNTSYYKNNTYDYLLPSRAAKRQRVESYDV